MLAPDPGPQVPLSVTQMTFVVPPVSVPATVATHDGWVAVPVWRAADQGPLVVEVDTAGVPCALGTVPTGGTTSLACFVGRGSWTVSATAEGAVLGRWSG